MTLAFPNPSRSFDTGRDAVRFSGYDGVFEVRFFVDAEVLARGRARGAKMSEDQYLSAFDSLRASIHGVAREAYSHGRLNTYTLKAADFR